MNKNIKITMVKGKMDINGNRRFVYNFIKDGINYNSEFKIIGRSTKRGLNSQTYPSTLEEYLRQLGSWEKLTVGDDLGKAQKSIDKCNKKEGCKKYCSNASMESCDLLNIRNECMNRLTVVQEFLKLDVEELEK